MIVDFQEEQLQANTIEQSILYVDNLKPMAFVYTVGKDVQVNPGGALEDRKEGIQFSGYRAISIPPYLKNES